jgi:hypothetical protein
MRILIFPLLFWMVYSSPLQVSVAAAVDPVIVSPKAGSVLQGVVAVDGSSDIEGFGSSEISFTYTDDPTSTWFLIQSNSQPVSNDRLVTWDTTVITDGNYVLRLRVTLTDGSTREVLVPDLRVRNYSPVETPTPHPVSPMATMIPTSAATATSYPTPTALSRNPASLTSLDVSDSMIYGGFAAILVFIIIGIYLRFRRK